MRVSTIDLQRASMSSISLTQERMSKAMEQVSTGKRFQHAADEPVTASRINLLKMNVEQLKSFQNNNVYAENQLSLVEATLSNITNALMRVDELRMQAMNGHLQRSEREILATELENQRNELMGLMNTKDADGQYLFAGHQTDHPPFIKQNGQYLYQGDNGARTVQVGSNLRVMTAPDGYALFENVQNGNGVFTITDGAVNNTGSAVIADAAVADADAYIADHYTLSFVTNSHGDLAYQVTGVSSGQVIPELPATIPDDAPIFVAGDAIHFNGMTIQIEGQPAGGDDFGIDPSHNQNVLESIQHLIDTLRLPMNSDSERAQYRNAMTRLSNDLSQNNARISQMITHIGASMKGLEHAKAINDDVILQNEKTLSVLEDVDPTEAISHFMAEMNALQIAQLSYSRVQALSLFNYF